MKPAGKFVVFKKVVGLLLFVFVFLLNTVFMFNNEDGTLSIEAVKAYAQSGGSGTGSGSAGNTYVRVAITLVCGSYEKKVWEFFPSCSPPPSTYCPPQIGTPVGRIVRHDGALIESTGYQTDNFKLTTTTEPSRTIATWDCRNLTSGVSCSGPADTGDDCSS